jgi:hypothetical protein
VFLKAVESYLSNINQEKMILFKYATDGPGFAGDESYETME